MKKAIFSVEEARRIAWQTEPKTLKLQLHQWVRSGEIIRLKRGIFALPGEVRDKMEVARALYGPAYVSLEFALHAYGLLPDVPFTVTLVTPKTTRKIDTPVGQFVYHKIKEDLFWGYDPVTLMGEREKALIDYLYLYRRRLIPHVEFWDSLRWQNLREVNFTKARAYAGRCRVKKVLELTKSLEEYRRTYGRR